MRAPRWLRPEPPHLRGQQPPVLGEVEDGLHHPVRIQQAKDVPNARLLPQRLAQAPAGLVMLHSRGAPHQHPAAEGGQTGHGAHSSTLELEGGADWSWSPIAAP